jgi:hypothetical protein
VRIGDRLRTRTGLELTVTRIDHGLLGREDFISFVEDSAEQWLKLPARWTGRSSSSTAGCNKNPRDPDAQDRWIQSSTLPRYVGDGAGDAAPWLPRVALLSAPSYGIVTPWGRRCGTF